MEKKKTHKLIGDFEISFSIFAISCTENQIKTAWNINKVLNIKLADYKKPIISSDPEFFYPVFTDNSSYENLSFSLIGNKTRELLLIKELPNIDFLLEVTGDISKFPKDEFIRKLKKIQGIIAVIELDLLRIKRKTPFVSQ